jgi:hypothetical protein
MIRFYFQKFYNPQNRRKFKIKKNHVAKRTNRKEIHSLY